MHKHSMFPLDLSFHAIYDIFFSLNFSEQSGEIKWYDIAID